jgi:hypothetical protein
MSLGHANLFFNQVEVIQQPFAGRRNAPVRLDRFCDEGANVNQDRFILGQPRQEMIRRVSRTQRVPSRERLAMLLHLFGTEQVGTQRGFVPGVMLRRTGSE